MNNNYRRFVFVVSLMAGLFAAPCGAEEAPETWSSLSAKLDTNLDEINSIKEYRNQQLAVGNYTGVCLKQIKLISDGKELVGIIGKMAQSVEAFLSAKTDMAAFVERETKWDAENCDPQTIRTNTRSALVKFNETYADKVPMAKARFEEIQSSFNDGRGPGCFNLKESIQGYRNAQQSLNNALKINDGVDYSNANLNEKLTDVNNRLQYADNLYASECSEAQLNQVRSTSDQFQNFVDQSNARAAAEAEAARRAAASDECGWACMNAQKSAEALRDAQTYDNARRSADARRENNCSGSNCNNH